MINILCKVAYDYDMDLSVAKGKLPPPPPPIPNLNALCEQHLCIMDLEQTRNFETFLWHILLYY